MMSKIIHTSPPLHSSLAPGKEHTPARRLKRKKSTTGLWIFLFLLPFLLLYGAFTLWPLIATVFYSFFDWGGISSITAQNFIGLGNYQELLHDPLFWQSFTNTLFFALANTVIKLPLSLFMAILLTRRWLWGKRFFRTIFFVPIILPVALAGQIFTFLLNPSNGALDSLLLQLHLIKEPIDLLGHDNTAIWAVIGVSVWQIFGQYMVYWMATLQNVPEELYEAAQIDRATPWQQFIHVTLPLISPMAVVISFLAIVNALQVFGIVVTLTAGGPGTSTYVLSYYIYESAFQNLPFRYGYASAVAVMFVTLAALFVSLQALLSRRSNQRSTNLMRGARA
ncbi:MAG: sugar ABC transporter permease [Ktedonobacteraceae bacterium]|nr:sugar ABC transporter permease [Ktedonobacteraceae bacterium]